ncbi:TonB-dependent receptor [Microbulbifer sp. GL-2]|uniref:TonB-dependent receptor n=1 Tax=Microbulbifer sp. GL-2 TaxID=2591606 RepID=UPI0011640B5D|nr:TonB-dependent receptor [Microbulbifer sp. GL-2]BBM00513.1 TonB-dependent receptor [Microbulbifer sp. GL-2]
MKKNLLSAAVKGALGLTAVAIMVPTMPAFAQEDADLVEEVVVTGSRIKRLEVESTSPVTVLDRSDIDLSGNATVADVLQNLSANSFGSFRGTSGQGSGAGTTREVNLRGLGATLVLIDGRRMPGLGYGGGQTQDVSQIPMALVERIEILKDGASAIYGSDAVAGVVNIITKRDVNGLTVTASTSSPTSVDGADSNKIEIAAGTSTDTSSLVFVYEHSTEDSIADTEFVGKLFGTSSYSPVPNVENADGDWIGSAQGDLCGNIASTTPGTFDRCLYAYSDVTWLFPETTKDTIMTKYRLDLSDDLTFNARLTAHKNEGQTRFAPTPVSTNTVSMEADNPLNPFGEEIAISMRAAPLGNRDTYTKRDNIDLVFGIEGGLDILNGMDYSINYQHTLANENVRGTNLIVDATIQQMIDDEEFDVLNVAERNADDYLAYVSEFYALAAHTGTYETVQERDIFDATISGELWSNGDISLSTALGAELEQFSFDQISDITSGLGGVSGGSGGDDVYSTQDRTSAYAEFILALPADVELNAAVRYDEYEQEGDVGLAVIDTSYDKVTSKLGAMWRPMEGLLLRASWSEGFRAPTLNDMFASQSFGFPGAYDYYYCDTLGNAASDTNYCKTDAQHKTLNGGNPNLDPEESESYSLGFVWDVNDDLTIEFNHYNIQYDQRIQAIDAEDILFLDQDGSSSNVTRLANGKVDSIQAGVVNYNGVETTGYDLATTYTLDSAYGVFAFGADLSYISQWDEDDPIRNEVRELVGDFSQPDFRANLSVDWSYNDYFASWHINHIAAQENLFDLAGYEDVGAYTSHNMQVGYNTPWNGKITLGARNIFDEEADFYSPTYYRGYSTSLYDPLGRSLYVRLQQSF